MSDLCAQVKCPAASPAARHTDGDARPGYRMMLRNLAAVAPITAMPGIGVFVVAYFIRDLDALLSVREALGVPLRVVRPSVSLQDVERRLTLDVTSGRGDDLRDAAASIVAGEGAGVEDIMINNDREVRTVAHEVMPWLRWL
jgi:hypothetical protein